MAIGNMKWRLPSISKFVFLAWVVLSSFAAQQLIPVYRPQTGDSTPPAPTVRVDGQETTETLGANTDPAVTDTVADDTGDMATDTESTYQAAGYYPDYEPHAAPEVVAAAPAPPPPSPANSNRSQAPPEAAPAAPSASGETAHAQGSQPLLLCVFGVICI